jgi:hypothetical protein
MVPFLQLELVRYVDNVGVVESTVGIGLSLEIFHPFETRLR